MNFSFSQMGNRFYDLMLSEASKERAEKVILWVAIASFLLHLLLIASVEMGWYQPGNDSGLLHNPIAAIYTPFSFILIYEVYLLVYYLPRSITTYIGKQYEIVTLIVLRRLFKDLSHLELSSEWFHIKDDLQFTYDLLASLVLFYLIYWFYRSVKTKATIPHKHSSTSLSRFIFFKKMLALLLVPSLLGLAVYRLWQWLGSTWWGLGGQSLQFQNLNNIFFDEFFTLLIVVDVVVLLLSFFYTDRFHTVIRNSGFVISTILIRLSFSVEGLVNTLLLLTAVVFGFLILRIHNSYLSLSSLGGEKLQKEAGGKN